MSKIKHLPQTSIWSARSFRAASIGIVTATTMLAGSVSSAVALDNVIEAKIKIINCTILLFTNPELHLTDCGVGEFGDFATLAPLIFTAYTAPPEEEEEPPSEPTPPSEPPPTYDYHTPTPS